MAAASASQPLLAGAVRLASAFGALAEGDERWRRAVIAELDPRDCDVILDARCGHAGLTIALAQAAPKAVVLGLDPREDALERARAKAAQAGVRLNLIHGHAQDIASYVNEVRPTKIVCTLSDGDDPATRRTLLIAARAALAPRGVLLLVKPVGPAPPLLAQLMGAPPPPEAQAAQMVDMMRQCGFVGVMTAGVFKGQASLVRLYRGAAP